MDVRPLTRPRPIFFGLALIRFSAAMMVMCVHFCTTSWAMNDATIGPILEGRVSFPELFSSTWVGWLGVEIFFVISGLVIVYSAQDATAATFLRSRVLRLYPAAWVCATTSAAILICLGIESHRLILRAWVASITLFPFGPWIDPVYWTLRVEISFYFLVFLFLAAREFRRLEQGALTLGTISSAYWILGGIFAPGFLEQHLWNGILDVSLVSYGCFFGLGAMMYVTFRDGNSLLRTLAIVLFAGAGLIEVDYKASDINLIYNSHESALLPQAVYALVLGCIFTSMRWASSVSNHWTRLIRVLGLATYPLYLFHQIAGAAIMRFVLMQGGSRYGALGAAILICVTGSILIATCVEPPIRSLLRKAITTGAEMSTHWQRSTKATMIGTTLPLRPGRLVQRAHKGRGSLRQ